MASDKDLIACEDDSEINYLLQKWGKKEDDVNRRILRAACRSARKHFGNNKRDSFYTFFEEIKLVDLLFNK